MTSVMWSLMPNGSVDELVQKIGSLNTELARGSRLAANEIDEIAVERTVHGEPVSLSLVERREAARQLRVFGYSIPQIARRLRMHEKQVVRDLERFGLLRSQSAA